MENNCAIGYKVRACNCSFLLLVAVMLFIPAIIHAQFSIARFFSDNMVLQQDKPICVWGKGKPGLKLVVKLGEAEARARVSSDSAWKVYFKSRGASSLPLTLSVTAKDIIIYCRNIVVGDVWLCLGQSNMEFPMRQEMHFASERKQPANPMIRFYNPAFIGKNVYGTQYTDSMKFRLTADSFYRAAVWQQCDSNTLQAFSAVGYFFGKAIQQHSKMPVGLINLSIGGCPIETFIPINALKQHPVFSKKATPGWMTNESLPVWIRERARQNIGNGTGVVNDDVGPNHAYKPGFAFNAGIEPLLSFPIKGIIWYQGESNAQEIERVMEYGALQQLMVKSFRENWNNQAMPFYWVQLSSIDTASYKSQLWPAFRDEQRKLLDSIRNSGMAVSMDVGARNDVHPTNKKVIGERLAIWELMKDSNSDRTVAAGPIPIAAHYADGIVTVEFRSSGSSLAASSRADIHGFSLDGINDCPATANGEKIQIKASLKPSYVYYGWKPFTDANLVDISGLPAPTFKLPVN